MNWSDATPSPANLDLATYALGAAVIAAVALLPGCVPLRRARTVDPVHALRTE